MKSKVFKSGNYVYECKTASGFLGGTVDAFYLQQSINKLKKRWEVYGMPSGYYYVFPTNYINKKCLEVINTFKNEYRGEVDIDYYDCDNVKNLINNLSRLSSFQSLVDYIQKVRG